MFADIGLAGRQDKEILEYSNKHDLILISGDKDFGELIKFGRLWEACGKVILLRYHLININCVVKDISEVLENERQTLDTKKQIVIMLSESGYRIHKTIAD